ncbi:MAG TPA: hypothetical protein VGB94_07645 [Acidobacteriaceae bacterium]
MQDLQAELNALVRRELWTSFVGLLRSHLGALQVTGRLYGAQFVEATQELEVNVRTAGAILTIRFDPESGTGIWTAYKGHQAMGSWSMTTGGSIAVDEQAMDMELAVEHFAARLV